MANPSLQPLQRVVLARCNTNNTALRLADLDGYPLQMELVP